MKKVVVASILLFFGCQLLPVFANEVEEIFAEVNPDGYGTYECPDDTYKEVFKSKIEPCAVARDKFGGGAYGGVGCSLDKKELVNRIRDGKCEFFEYEHYRCSAENQECTMVVRSDGKGYYSCSHKKGQRTHYSHQKFDDATEYLNTWKCIKDE